jgi:hypothetical protein
MFTDLVGSTARPPGSCRRSSQMCNETVPRFGGFVAKYMSDGVLIYFGYPQAHEDDADGLCARDWRNGARLGQHGVPYDMGMCRGSPVIVDVELHRAFLSHFQQEGLASFLIHDIGALHDLVDFQRLLAKRAQDIFSIIQHDQNPIPSSLDQWAYES